MMSSRTDCGLEDLAARVLAGRGIGHKADIAGVVGMLGRPPGAVAIGDDCAAIADGDGYLLFAIEGFISDFVAADPRFAGYCGVMVNLSDIAAMGGRPIAVVDAVWSEGLEQAAPILQGLRQAADIYGVPIVGGHTNTRSGEGQLAVAVLGRAQRLITSFDARDGDVLVAAFDLRGRFRGDSLNWDASSGAPGERLRGDLAVLPVLAEAGLVEAGKDISMAGLVGTTMMLAEASGRGAHIDVDAVPCPPDVALDRFLLAFPSFGFVLSVRPDRAGVVLERFAERSISAAVIGAIDASRTVRLTRGDHAVTIWDFERPFIGCAPADSRSFDIAATRPAHA